MLVCPDCGTDCSHTAAWRCDCGSPLEPAAELGPAPGTTPPAPGEIDRAAGVWSFEAALPDRPPVSLGEGWTPLVEAPTLAAGRARTAVKLEYVSPTGSFKDRGAAVTVALARDLGVDRVLEDSSGNAGLAVATYAARAGLDARIYVPEGATAGAVAAIERTGADLRRVPGDRAAVAAACQAAVDAGEGWYASHAWQPAFLAGTATFAYELAAQRDWTVPDAVVTPVGHGTLLLGAARGFRALAAAGWTDREPRLLGVQAAGVAPLVADRHGEAAVPADRNDLAAGIQVAEPARGGQIQAALDRTGGDVLAVGREATAAARDRLARAGLHAAPTSAVALAGLERYREAGLVGPEADVVLPLTGSGLAG